MEVGGDANRNGSVQNPSVSLPQSTPCGFQSCPLTVQLKSQCGWMLKCKQTFIGLMENKRSTSPRPTEDRQCPLMGILGHQGTAGLFEL